MQRIHIASTTPALIVFLICFAGGCANDVRFVSLTVTVFDAELRQPIAGAAVEAVSPHPERQAKPPAFAGIVQTDAYGDASLRVSMPTAGTIVRCSAADYLTREVALPAKATLS